MQYPIKLKMADGTEKEFWLSDEKLQFGGGGSGGVTDVQVEGTSIVNDGVAEIQYCDPAGAVSGVISLGSGFTTYDAANNKGLAARIATVTQINNRYDKKFSNFPVTSRSFSDNLRIAFTDGKDAAWTAEEQQAAQERLGINKEWVLKGTMTSADAIEVDLSGCAEMIIAGYTVGTSSGNLVGSINGTKILVAGAVSNNTKYTYTHIKDDGIGNMVCDVCKYGSTVLTVTSAIGGFTHFDTAVSDVTSVFFNNPALVTSCDLKIYAR